jgi:transposase
MKRLDYTGKRIFVGIDVHKKTYSVAVLCEGEIMKRDTLTASPETLVSYLKKYFQGAEVFSAYEAGFSGFYLHRKLVENGINNIVVHAAAIEISARDKVKTDKRDALKIATQLLANRLNGIYIPTVEMEDRRELSRLRNTLVKEKNRTAARLKQKANYYGLIGPLDEKKVTTNWIKSILAHEHLHGLRVCLEMLSEQWHSYTEQIKKIDKELKEQAEVDELKETVYRSAKGIGPTAARILSNELGDMSQFNSERALFCYTGFTPSEYSSGDHIRRGHISRQGKSHLRKILVQCSSIAIRYDTSLKEIYDRIAHRAGGKRAIVAVARRLIERLRSCFRNNTLWPC